MSCFQFSNARAARTYRPVIIHDHLRQTTCAHQKYDYNGRPDRIQRRLDAIWSNFDGRRAKPVRLVAIDGLVASRLPLGPRSRKGGNP
jgi:hypothetical protein